MFEEILKTALKPFEYLANKSHSEKGKWKKRILQSIAMIYIWVFMGLWFFMFWMIGKMLGEIT